MQIIRPFNNPQNHVVGYRQYWYGGSTFWTPNDDKVLRVSMIKLQECAVSLSWFGFKLQENYFFRPVPVSYESTLYCIDKAVAVHSVLTSKPIKMTGIPKEIITIISTKQEFIVDAAKKLKLPLERLVLRA